ncbi:MAG TPA: DUF1614 domain-containing protein [Bacillota bacterium]|nr:DUF1614 domain-containing protein [Bacillota bacterium]
MPLGLTLLVVASILVLFGVGHNILDRMRLNDKTALLFIAAIFIGGLIPDISLGRYFSINIGGAIIPLILVGYLFVKAGTGKEKARSIWATILAATAIFIAGKLLPDDPEAMFVDPNYVYGVLAGVIAYLFGRSRRASFIAGVGGVVLADIAQGFENIIRNIPAAISIGGAGALDIVVISGLLAVILAEVVGEFREKLQGGTDKKHMRFDHAEFTSAIGAEDQKINEDGQKEKECDCHEKKSK